MNELTAPELSQLPSLPTEDIKQTVDKVGAYVDALAAAKRATTDQSTINEIDDQIRKYSAFKIRCQMELGERTAKMEKANKWKTSNPNSRDLTKAEHLSSLGISSQRASEYENLVKPENKPIVERYLEEQEELKEAPTLSGVLKEIKAATKPHVVNNSGDNEWYTPSEYIEAAREVMGSIDLDPASNDFANQTVKAATYYTAETNGLNKEWYGNIWLNPPYSSTLIKQFAEKLSKSNFEQAVILVNNATETGWFLQMIKKASAVVFPTGRIRFEKADRVGNAPLQGQAFIYCGQNSEYFLEVFEQYGWGALL